MIKYQSSLEVLLSFIDELGINKEVVLGSVELLEEVEAKRDEILEIYDKSWSVLLGIIRLRKKILIWITTERWTSRKYYAEVRICCRNLNAHNDKILRYNNLISDIGIYLPRCIIDRNCSLIEDLRSSVRD